VVDIAGVAPFLVPGRALELLEPTDMGRRRPPPSRATRGGSGAKRRALLMEAWASCGHPREHHHHGPALSRMKLHSSGVLEVW